MNGLVAQASFPSIVRADWLVLLFPAAGTLLLMFYGQRMKRAAGAIATLMMTGAFVVTGITFFEVVGQPEGNRVFVQTLYKFFTAGRLSVNVDYRIDPLSITMMLVVTGVGTLIHLYSIGYMRGDPREGRYFSYLNLFAFSMLLLVMANNFLVMFVGWELVGLCSYLLIGFWFDREQAAVAAKKAFITNRVGDFSFIIGLFLIFAHFGTLDFGKVFASAPATITVGTATAIGLLLFGGAAGKSAQIPLYVWLPDAMLGPTPVSALIHAATMVTAGVYMVARTHVIYDLSHTAGAVVAAIGVATMLMAGLIAIAQDDIKRVLAYSTISQLGYMFVGVGVGAYTAGMFHLVTHAFFKALLFLAAGSVLHALADRGDITKMGGLWRKIPWTAFTFTLGWLAIIAFPGTAGFFSKDQVLEGAYGAGRTSIWVIGVIGAAITGFYMTRLLYLVFFGRSRDTEGLHPHESPVSMVFPMVLLGIAAIIGGFLVNGNGENGRLARFLEPSVAPAAASASASRAEVGALPHREGGLSAGALSGIATAAGLGGAAVAFAMYGGLFDWERRRENPGLAWRAVRNKFFVDDVYQFLFTSLGRLGASALAFVVDAKFIDGIVNGFGTVTSRVAAVGRRVQTGFVRSYALGILGGTVILLGFFIG
ncbi:MAG: NADH-quinone oxidoreductase subunit L, partial [Actinomycetota bacterium]